jgi:dTDP-4-amino-4,6-dideoxygalactose transaminase
MPAFCCESVALAVHYAGFQLRFAESDRESLCITPETVVPLIDEETRAVIVVHIFGRDAEVGRFERLRESFPDTVFIEDIAHSFGGTDRNDRVLGGGLDFALLSFAEGKIVGGDGGMLTWRSSSFSHDEISDAASHAVARRFDSLLALSLRNMVHGLADLWRERPLSKIDVAFRAVVSSYRDLIVCSGGIADTDELSRAFGQLEDQRKERYRRYKCYEQGVASKHARIHLLHEGSMCWRAAFIFDDPDRVRQVTDRLRSKGIDASNHYFPLNLLFGSLSLPVTESLSSRILNLWVNDQATDEKVRQAISIINAC